MINTFDNLNFPNNTFVFEYSSTKAKRIESLGTFAHQTHTTQSHEFGVITYTTRQDCWLNIEVGKMAECILINEFCVYNLFVEMCSMTLLFGPYKCDKIVYKRGPFDKKIRPFSGLQNIIFLLYGKLAI